MVRRQKEQDDAGKGAVVGVRLDPKIRYLADLAARKQRRSINSFIEWVILNSFGTVELRIDRDRSGNKIPVTLEDSAWRLWDADPAERFARLAILFPDLMTHEEHERWKALSDSGLLNPAKHRDEHNGNEIDWQWAILEDDVFPKLRDHWPNLIAAADGGPQALRKWVNDVRAEIANTSSNSKSRGSKHTSSSDLDDEIPF
jgi:hypothetical protein